MKKILFIIILLSGMASKADTLMTRAFLDKGKVELYDCGTMYKSVITTDSTQLVNYVVKKDVLSFNYISHANSCFLIAKDISIQIGKSPKGNYYIYVSQYSKDGWIKHPGTIQYINKYLVDRMSYNKA